MILARIKRGATRTSVLVALKLERFVRMPFRSTSDAIRKAALLTLAFRFVTLSLTPVQAATIPGSTEDTTDPSPAVRVVSAAISFDPHATESDGTPFYAQNYSLVQVSVGTSYATEEAQAAAALAAQQAAAQAAAAAAAAKAKAANKVVDAAPAVTTDVDSVKSIIVAAANQYGVSSDLMLRIAACESGYNPSSRNHGGSSASGLFQFMPSTYYNSPQGESGLSIWDPTANAEAAAYKIANGGLNAWDASRSCWD